MLPTAGGDDVASIPKKDISFSWNCSANKLFFFAFLAMEEEEEEEEEDVQAEKSMSRVGTAGNPCLVCLMLSCGTPEEGGRPCS